MSEKKMNNEIFKESTEYAKKAEVFDEKEIDLKTRNNSKIVDIYEKNAVKKAEDSLKLKGEIPYGYIEIEYDTLGKLGNPKSLHFRNYSMEEALEMATSNNEDLLFTIVKCLNNMVYEDFDCANFHEKELELTLLNLYFKFWGREIKSIPYKVDESKPES